MKTAAFATLGCKVNFYETEALIDLFNRAGYAITDFNNPADVYIINTCTVTHLSDRKCRQLIRRARRKSPQAIIAVTGCYAQVFPQELAQIPEVNLMVGTHNRQEFPRLVEEASPGAKLEMVHPYEESPAFERLSYRANRSRTRAFLKVQEGCEQYCNYCIVPLARGPARSAPLEDVLVEARHIAAAGYREVVITGIRLGMYEDKAAGIKLGGLLKEIEKAAPALERIRLSSLEPSDFDEELVHIIASSQKICPHLHIPLQSGNDYILKKMNRPYNTREYRELVQHLRQLMPHLALGTDVMVGFPGETAEHHRRSYEFLKEISFSRLHVFRFSPRPGTAAAEMENPVDPLTREERWHEINALGQQMARRYREKFYGAEVKILVEKANSDGHVNYLEGFTAHYLRARAVYDGPEAFPNRKGREKPEAFREWKGHDGPEAPRDWKGRMALVKIESVREEILEGKFLLEK